MSTLFMFKGNCETPTNCTDEHDKDGSITTLEVQVVSNGLQNVFSIPDSNGVMHIIV